MQPLRRDSAPLTPGLTLLLAFATGTAVSAIYLNQPLLSTLAKSLNASHETVGLISTLTQVGYGLGILLIVPLGDILPRKRLVTGKLALLAVALVLGGAATTVSALWAGSLLIGVLATVAQDIVPLAADLAAPERRGRIIGTVMSGLLLGILCSRTFSGVIAEHLGWRAVFFAAATLVAVIAVILLFALPAPPPRSSLRYVDLLRSMAAQVRDQDQLRRSVLTQGLLGIAFSAFWTNLSFFLGGPPLGLSDGQIGLFGLAGAAGALAAPLAGRLGDKRGPYAGVLSGVVLVAVSFGLMLMGPSSLIIIIAGAVIFDLGVQMSLVSHQTIIYALDGNARARLNAVFVSGMFLAFSLGSLVSVHLKERFGWPAVLLLGFVASLAALVSAVRASRTGTSTVLRRATG
jgi:predicted MFS family arabinose efflux permease